MNALYLDSAALNLHGFYSGLERLFELIARHVDGPFQWGDLASGFAPMDRIENPGAG